MKMTLDKDKVALLEKKLDTDGQAGQDPAAAPNLEDYIIPEEHIHLYHKATWQEYNGEMRHVFPYARFRTEEATQDQITEIVEIAENSAENWRLVSIIPVARRPGKTTGVRYLLSFRTVLAYALPPVTSFPTADSTPEETPSEETYTTKAEEWEKSE